MGVYTEPPWVLLSEMEQYLRYQAWFQVAMSTLRRDFVAQDCSRNLFLNTVPATSLSMAQRLITGSSLVVMVFINQPTSHQTPPLLVDHIILLHGLVCKLFNSTQRGERVPLFTSETDKWQQAFSLLTLSACRHS